MTYKFLKTAIFSISALAMIVISSCTKPLPGRTDFTTVNQEFVILQKSGFANFATTAYNRGSDTVNLDVIVDLASSANPSASTTVNIKYDPAAIATYNTANPLPGYVALPAANFKLLATMLTIPAGQHYAQTTLQIYTKGLDPAVNYMTPISLVDASGKLLSSNLNTTFYHTIGNPLAGPYSWDFYRRNGTSDTSAAPNSTVTLGQLVNISPSGPTTLLFPEGYLNVFVDASPLISLSFTNTGGVFSNFTGFLEDKIKNEITDPAGFGGSIITSTVLVGYNIVGNAGTKYAGSSFRFYTSIKNSGGGIRTLVDNFTKL